jgi:hypothetical protein
MLQMGCSRLSADFGNVGQKDTALRVAKRGDPGNLAPLMPGWRNGIGTSALLFDCSGDRIGNARIKTVRKQQDTFAGQRHRTKKKRVPRSEERASDSVIDNPGATTFSGTWRSGSREAHSRER